MTAQILAFAPRRAHLAAHERDAIERMGACLPPRDPFGVVDPCELSPDGTHDPVMDCCELVCRNCAAIFWR